MVKDLISVILPVYKPDPHHFKLCFDSILNQTYRDLELIIIYKKSTKEIDQEIRKIFNENTAEQKIRVIESDADVVDARNYGIKMSNGNLIGIIDADDICANTRFKEQIEFMQETKVSLVGSWAFSISHEGKVIGKIEPPYKPTEIRKKIMFHNPILHSSVLMQKELLEKIGYYKSDFYPGAEDYELYLRAISKNYKIANIPKHLIHLRETRTSIMRGNQWKVARKYYMKAKRTALLSYGFTQYYDIFYFFLTPLVIFISPKMAHMLKNNLGWNKKM